MGISGSAVMALGFVIGGALSDSPQATFDITQTTKFDLALNSGRVIGCTITATSGNPKVDQYVCDAARSCGDRFSDADRRASCVADKRAQLAERIAKNPKWLKYN